MEMEDALSAKFRALIEGLMVATTSEIVKIFSKVLLETRVEITRSWKEIDLLKQHLEECEQQKEEAIIKAQRIDFKREDNETEVSRVNSQPDVQGSNTVRPGALGTEESTENVSVKNRSVILGNAKVRRHQRKRDTAQLSKPDSSGQNIFVPIHGTKGKKTKCTQLVVKHKNTKMICPRKVSQIKGQKLLSSPTTSQKATKICANGPSTSADISATSPQEEMIKKANLISSQKHANDVSVARALRDRQHLSLQRHCLCCSSDECDIQSSPSRAQHKVPSVYICRKCERRFKTDLLFKSHKCSMPQDCSKCGQMFTTLQGLSAHSEEVEPQLSCSNCEQMFATQCAWTVHKSTHTNLIIPKEIKSKKFEVRLERISDSQLEAALSSSSSFMQNTSSAQNLLSHPQKMAAVDTSTETACKSGAESTMVSLPETSKTQLSSQSIAESQDSRPATLSDSCVGQSSVRKVYAVMSTASCQIQISEDPNEAGPSTAQETEKVTDDEKLPSATDESVLSTPPKKRKIADCCHDAYNGVFPVENILRWRNNKGRNEVRVKWMPCTLCGAKFQNTWEPAESFPGYLEDKSEEAKKN